MRERWGLADAKSRAPVTMPRATTTRVSPMGPPIGVNIDGTCFGRPEVLRTILATDVISVRRLSMSQTSVGIDRHHRDGIMEVTLRHDE